jgi:hypothetical protein
VRSTSIRNTVEDMEMLGGSERTIYIASRDEGYFFFVVKIPTMFEGVGMFSRLK